MTLDCREGYAVAMTAMRIALATFGAGLIACSPAEPDAPALIIEPVETFYQPIVDDFFVNRPIALVTEIDVVIRNVSTESVFLDRCVPSDSLPVFGIRQDDGTNSALVAERVCISAGQYEIPAGSQRTMVFRERRELGCNRWSCLLPETKTSGYHRLVLFGDGREYASRRFYLRAPSYSYD